MPGEYPQQKMSGTLCVKQLSPLRSVVCMPPMTVLLEKIDLCCGLSGDKPCPIQVAMWVLVCKLQKGSDFPV